MSSSTALRFCGVVLPVVSLLLSGEAAPALAEQVVQIGIVDLYGVGRVGADRVRQALSFKEGDSIDMAAAERPAALVESEQRVSMLPGVVGAHIKLVCCDEGRAIAYVGVVEAGARGPSLRKAPAGSVRLAPDVVRSGDDFVDALVKAVEAGNAGEDDSQGHALAHDPAMRAVQERFTALAARDLPQLRKVLRESSDARHRALAAQVLGYVANKQVVVDDLVHAMTDPDDAVRNNGMRTLLVFAAADPARAPVAHRVPSEPFVAMLESPVWSDRNKASGALMALTSSRAPALLARLRRGRLKALVEMARWRSEGHAIPAFLVLGRVAGYSDEAVHAAWQRGEREMVIGAALQSASVVRTPKR
jgi:hypothetical protein